MIKTQTRRRHVPIPRGLRRGLFCVIALQSWLHAESRWKIDSDGGITWTVDRGHAHEDHIEMSGRKVSLILTYGVRENGSPVISRHIVFPGLRTVPNDTHASLSYIFGQDAEPRIFIDGRPVSNESVTRVHHRGLTTMDSVLGDKGDIALTRTIFPSVDKPLVIEKFTFKNNRKNPANLELENTQKLVRTNPARGVTGEYHISSRVMEETPVQIAPGESASFTLAFSARQANQQPLQVQTDVEERARRERIDGFLSKLRLETPDPVLNTAFAFAKIRTAESVYETKGGLMHGPGGGTYYAAIWANDQAEYADPFFPFLGDATDNEAAVNSFRLFAKYINNDFKPIPSSIIAEGTSYWNGAGDRGDMAMIAYGAGRFALAYGDRKTGEELWTLISWCLEYCRRKINAEGVVASDSDELEGRFPAGKANLSTSSLYYDALNSAALLGRQLGKPETELNAYSDQAQNIRSAINRYFGAKVQGFDAYRYYDGNTVLRAWICVPLAMGIEDRKIGVIDALFSPALWTADGLATQSGEKTFWDRATLYALRGVLYAGDTERAMDFLKRYSERRLLGEHVPYPVEAWPEGNQRHLAAESALYCRVFTEGLFGIRPTGFRSFTVLPRLPAGWNTMSLREVHAFGTAFDLVVARTETGLRIETWRNDRLESAKAAQPEELVDFAFQGARSSTTRPHIRQIIRTAVGSKLEFNVSNPVIAVRRLCQRTVAANFPDSRLHQSNF